MPKFDRDCITVNHAACRATIRVSAIVDPSARAGGTQARRRSFVHVRRPGQRPPLRHRRAARRDTGTPPARLRNCRGRCGTAGTSRRWSRVSRTSSRRTFASSTRTSTSTTTRLQPRTATTGRTACCRRTYATRTCTTWARRRRQCSRATACRRAPVGRRARHALSEHARADRAVQRAADGSRRDRRRNFGGGHEQRRKAMNKPRRESSPRVPPRVNKGAKSVLAATQRRASSLTQHTPCDASCC